MVKQNNKLTWTFQIILFVALMFFGIAKFLVPPDQAAEVFGKIGGTTAQYLAGVYQILSAILVIFPTTAFIGALIIAISMIVIIILHLTILGMAGPFLILTIVAILILIISIYVMKKRRKDLFRRK